MINEAVCRLRGLRLDAVESISAEQDVARLAFSSDDLPPELDERARFSLWRDVYVATICKLDMTRLPDRPFFARSDVTVLNDLYVGRMESTVTRFARTTQQIAADPRGNGFFLTFNRGDQPLTIRQLGREHSFSGGSPSLSSTCESGEHLARTANSFQGLFVPRTRLAELVANVDDMLLMPIDADTEAVRHLRRYVDMLAQPNGIGEDPVLNEHIATTLLDLTAIALGAARDNGELARMRGLRAARLQAVLAAIRSKFLDPAFSSQDVAAALGFTRRYVNDLLYQTGTTFAERVLELRLQKARIMLSQARHNALKVSDIALACGFNETSYFNRCFRHRFGASPTEFRASARR
jgi:AraC-like DNA-binding protein